MGSERNSLCPCGSGLKYKKCCLNNEIDSNAWRLSQARCSKASKDLIPKVMKFVSEFYGEECIYEAWYDFWQYEDDSNCVFEEFEFDHHLNPMFMPWFFYRWMPDHDFHELPEDVPLDSPAVALLEFKPNIPTPDEMKYILSSSQKGLSFYETLQVSPGKWVEVMDLLTEEVFTVYEKMGTENLDRGSIFTGRVINFDSYHFFDGVATFLIPPQFKIQILDYREFLIEEGFTDSDSYTSIDNDVLLEIENLTLDIFAGIYQQIFHPEPPIMTNTEGHRMVPHELTYKIGSADETFEALHKLCPHETKKDLLEMAELDSNGKILKIDFPWLYKKRANCKKSNFKDATVLGNIDIDGNTMKVKLNSVERVEKFKKILSTKMKSCYELKSTIIEDSEKEMERLGRNRRIQTFAEDGEIEFCDAGEEKEIDLNSHPELLKKMTDELTQHWERWPEHPLPTLNGETPREAIKTDSGRKKVTALIEGFEDNIRRRPMPGLPPKTFEKLRQSLDLPSGR